MERKVLGRGLEALIPVEDQGIRERVQIERPLIPRDGA